MDHRPYDLSRFGSKGTTLFLERSSPQRSRTRRALLGSVQQPGVTLCSTKRLKCISAIAIVIVGVSWRRNLATVVDASLTNFLNLLNESGSACALVSIVSMAHQTLNILVSDRDVQARTVESITPFWINFVELSVKASRSDIRLAYAKRDSPFVSNAARQADAADFFVGKP